MTDPFNERLWRRARHYVASRQIPAAQAVLESLLQRDPLNVPARMLLAGVHLELGRVREAAEQTLLAARTPGQSADALATVALCLVRVGEMTAARDCLASVQAANPTLSASQCFELAKAYQSLGDYAASLAVLERARAGGYDTPDFRLFHALQLQYNGRLDEARGCLESCLSRDAVSGRACLALSRLSRVTPTANHLDFIRTRLLHVERGSEEQAALEFAAFEERHQLSDHVGAFDALARANAIMHARSASGTGREDASFDALVRVTGARFMHAALPKRPDGPRPIFIVGMPRSGTTLLERMLGNHPDVVSAGERPDFPRQLRWVANLHGDDVIDPRLVEALGALDCAEVGRRYLQQTQWRAGNRSFFIDKLPHNYMLLGIVHRALPAAPILHLVRDPMDVCFSNYPVLLGDNYPYSYDLAALAKRYTGYRRLMDHWHEVMPGAVMDVGLADLVRAPEATLARVYAHCGLRQVAGCGDVTRNHAAVATLSSAQVRNPVRVPRAPAWGHYAQQLAPLQALLQHAGFNISASGTR